MFLLSFRKTKLLTFHALVSCNVSSPITSYQLTFSSSIRPLALRVECLLMFLETRVHSQVESYQRFKKTLLDAALLNTQHYKVWTKGKMEQSREWSSALTYNLSVVAIKKGAFRSPSTIVANNSSISKEAAMFFTF